MNISIIIPVYNTGKYIENTLNSILKQTIKNIEVICINDGSTDNSIELIKKYKSKFNSIKIINQENLGSGIARNNGIKESKGEYIAFLDSDDIFLDSDALEKMYNFGIENDANIICGNLKRINKKGELEYNFNYEQKNYAYFSNYKTISSKEYGIPWAFYKNIYKRTFLEEHNIKFPDLKRGQDPVFLANVLTKTSTISTVPVNLYGYNYSTDGGANNKVNTYTKKIDYIKHFKYTFNILEENKFNEISEQYKKKLENYLMLPQNIKDKSLFEIVHEIFGNNKEYYNTVHDELFYLKLNLINYEDYEIFKKNLNNIKKELFYINLNEDYFLNLNLIKQYQEINSKYLEKEENDITNFLLKIKEKNPQLIKENKSLSVTVNEKSIENNKLKEENEKLVTSINWKSTSPLRKINHLFRR